MAMPRHTERDTSADICKDRAVNPSQAAAPTSRRILDATAEVLGRNGVSKLSLSDVAAEAGVSRPTLYRWFASKQELIDAFSLYETELFETGIAAAMAGLRGIDKLDAALQFIVAFQQSYSGMRMIDVEPEQVIARIGWVLPIMRARLEHLISGADRATAAATTTRVAISHYIVRTDDADQFLAQLRHAAGRQGPARPGERARHRARQNEACQNDELGHRQRAAQSHPGRLVLRAGAHRSGLRRTSPSPRPGSARRRNRASTPRPRCWCTAPTKRCRLPSRPSFSPRAPRQPICRTNPSRRHRDTSPCPGMRWTAWFEEGRQLVHYPPNPYHRVDCRPTSRRLQVSIDGTTLVDT